jgi:enoyl-CoA hydratase
MRADRLSAYEQWSMPLSSALETEVNRGMDVIRSGETREGATRFAEGAGRHGSSPSEPKRIGGETRGSFDG